MVVVVVGSIRTYPTKSLCYSLHAISCLHRQEKCPAVPNNILCILFRMSLLTTQTILHRLLSHHHLTQQEVADAINTTQASVSRLARGESGKQHDTALRLKALYDLFEKRSGHSGPE